MRKAFVQFAIALILHTNLSAQISEYIYPNSGSPSFSNYGTTGLIQMPSARFYEEGTIGFTWSHLDPYLRGSIMAYPFNWFEASYQYADVNNWLYSPYKDFSGNQSYKDKSFSTKFRLLKESKYIPSVAVGFRDLGGTGLFASEYLVFSKFLGNIDFTAGMGWGVISNNSISNPLAKIDERFDDRLVNSVSGKGTQGGEFNISSFFSGKEAGLFAGAEIFIPKAKGIRVKLEYDATDYTKEGYLPVEQSSDFNFNLTYPITKNFQIKLGYIRGNTLNFGFSYTGSYGKKDPFIKKNDPPKTVPNAAAFRRVNAREPRNLYISSLKYLGESKLYLQSADLNGSEYSVAFSQNTHVSYARAAGRVARILDQIAPESVETFKITNLNAEMPLFTTKIDRKNFKKYESLNLHSALLESSEIYKISNEEYRGHKYQPPSDIPKVLSKISPAVRSQIGGPDGFYFGDVSVAWHNEILLAENFSILAIANFGIVDNFDDLKLASDSIIPHVRTDIVKYLKQSKKGRVSRLQANYFIKPRDNIYFKFTGGLIEEMFGGLGAEFLWRPFTKNYAIGTELWRVQQRDYDMLFSFRDYMTTTGFINYYYAEPRSKIMLKVTGGRFLAGDSGIHIDISRRFKSGFRVGVFASKTDISKLEFGEGSFDKGFYFHLPIEVFYPNYSKGVAGFGLRPLTRDGAAILVHGHHLYGVTDQSSYMNIFRDWDDIYD